MIGANYLGFAFPVVETISQAKTAATNVFTTIDQQSKINPFENKGIIPQSTKGHIRFRDVHFTYPSRPGVKVRLFHNFFL